MAAVRRQFFLVAVACRLTLSTPFRHHILRTPRLLPSVLFSSGIASEDAVKQMSVRELKQLAKENSIPTDDCFDKESLVSRLLQPPPPPSTEDSSGEATAAEAGANGGGGGGDGGDFDEAAALEAALEELRPSSIRELKTVIFRAGLSSRGLFEKAEILAVAAQAKVLLDKRALELPDDARDYIAGQVQFFGRLSCPYCIDALKVLEARGVTDEALQRQQSREKGGGAAPVVMRDVEKDRAAAMDMQRLSGGGGGVPFFYSEKTGKHTAGWLPGAESLDWIVQKLC